MNQATSSLFGFPVSSNSFASGTVVLFAGLFALILTLIRPVFPVDDAYITLHNARVLLAGGTDAVYGGTALDGATSLVHLALVAGFGLLMPLEVGSNILGIIAVMAYALGLARLAAETRTSPWLIAGLGILSAYLPYSLTNGLETGIAMAVVLWLVLWQNNPKLGLLAGIAPFVRPELGILAALYMTRQLWLHRRNPRAAAAAICGALLTSLPFFLWSLSMTGALIPATGGAKIAFFAEIAAPLIIKLQAASWGFLLSMLLPLSVGIIGLAVRIPSFFAKATNTKILNVPIINSSSNLILLAWLMIWTLTAVWSLPTGLGHNFHRYLAPLVPALLVGWIALSRRSGWWHRAFLAVSVFSLLAGALGIRARVRTERSDTMLVMAEKSRTLIPPGTTVLIHDAGYLAWVRPDLKLIDIVGLKSKANIEVHQRLTQKTGNRAPAIVEIATRSKPTMMVLYDQNALWGDMVTALKGAGWQLEKLTPTIGNNYSFYRITPPTRE